MVSTIHFCRGDEAIYLANASDQHKRRRSGGEEVTPALSMRAGITCLRGSGREMKAFHIPAQAWRNTPQEFGGSLSFGDSGVQVG